ncbi:MAG: helix-turn-helix transcriptional regulator [Bacilli bacterium]|nr:helix-turn-helix transcriptional regulator [Bacilli bacterium]
MEKNYTDARKILANNIVYFRLKNNWSQEEFAEELGTTTTYVSNLENGRRNTRIDYIENIADVLGVPIDQLLVDREPVKKRRAPRK